MWEEVVAPERAQHDAIHLVFSLAERITVLAQVQEIYLATTLRETA